MNTRQEKIDLLVEDYLDAIAQSSSFVVGIVRNGFKGFDNMTDEELDEAIEDASLGEDEDEDDVGPPIASVGMQTGADLAQSVLDAVEADDPGRRKHWWEGGKR